MIKALTFFVVNWIAVVLILTWAKGASLKDFREVMQITIFAGASALITLSMLYLVVYFF